MKKRICAIMCLFFCLVAFCGCSQVSYQKIYNSDGTIIDCVIVSLDSEDIASAGYNYNYVEYEILNKMSGYLSSIVISQLNNLDSQTKQEVLRNDNIQYEATKNSDGNLQAYIKFKNEDIYKAFYQVQPTSITDLEKQSNVFFDKYIDQSTSIFASDLCEQIENDILTEFPRFNLSGVTYQYAIACEDDLHTNCDQHFTNNGLNYYVWQENGLNKDSSIEIYYYGIHAVYWYIFAIVLSVAVLFVVLFVAKKHEKRKLAQNTTNQND